MHNVIKLKCSCSCCNNQVGSDGKIIYALKYTDDVVTLKLGEMGCILTRKILLSVFLVALNIAVLGYKIHTAQSTSHSHKYGHSHSHDQCKAMMFLRGGGGVPRHIININLHMFLIL